MIRRKTPPDQELKDNHRTYREARPVNTLTYTTGDTAMVPQVYTDRNGLPVMYDIATQEKTQSKSETNTISVLWHELITPLTVIKGYAATLLQLNDVITEEQKEQYLKGIDSASNRVIRLLENLRDITKLEETTSLSFQRISLIDMLRQMASEVQNQTTKHVIKLLPSGRLPLIKADPEKIEMVISNLLGNSIKYSPQGGKIRLSGQVLPNQIIVCVSDQGPGIASDDIPHVFDRFYRAADASRNTKGAGLGLYLARAVVEAHGGRIWVDPKPGEGARICFSLPRS